MSRPGVRRLADPMTCPSVVELRRARTADLVSAFRQVAAAADPDPHAKRVRLSRIELELYARDSGARS